MTSAELMALLREAQAQAESVDGLSVALSRRIDAALAEHDAEPEVETESVEWEQLDGYARATRIPFEFEVEEWGRFWEWRVTKIGNAPTVDEAKAAALKAARSAR